MGIFNEQSFDHPFAKGIQGASGVGFSLTADGNYDMNKKNSQMLEHLVIIAELPRARSGAPWVRKFGKLSIPENLVMT